MSTQPITRDELVAWHLDDLMVRMNLGHDEAIGMAEYRADTHIARRSRKGGSKPLHAYRLPEIHIYIGGAK